MRSRLSFCTLFASVLAIASLPGTAGAWGWATHAYLVNQLGVSDRDAVYGALVPDVGYAMDPAFNDFIHEETTHKFDRLVGMGFQTGLEETSWGVASHNERWGADSTAHAADGGYVTVKAPALVALTGLDGELAEIFAAAGIPEADAEALGGYFATTIAHEAIEYAVDILIKEGPSPLVGWTILEAAQFRDPRVPDLLVRAYAANFAARFKMKIPEAGGLLEAGEAGFQGFMIDYGALLAFYDRADITGILAAQGSAKLHDYIYGLTGLDVTVPPEILAGVLDQAFVVTEPDGLSAVEETREILQWNLSHRIRPID